MKKTRRKITLLLTAAMLTGVFAGCGSDSAGAKDSAASAQGNSPSEENSDAVTVRVGDNMALGTVTPFVAEDLGYFEEAGINVEILEFSDGSALAEAFAAGEIDVALMGIAPTATWYQKGVDLQVIASANGGGHVILVKSDSGIETVADLKGKILAEPSLGTVTDTLLRDYILPGAGLDPENDLIIQPGLKPADMATALYATGEVDAILTWEPYASQAKAQYGDEVKVLYDSPAVIREATGGDAFYPVNVVSASQDFITNHPDEVQKFMDVYKKTVDYINEDAGANAEIAKVLNLDESIVEASRVRVDFTYDIDVEGLTTTLTWAKDLGYMDEIPDAEAFYNSEFLK